MVSDRLNAYSKPIPDGISVDIEGMAVDLVTVAKCGGATREQFLDLLGAVFDAVDVEITIPESAKN